MVSERSMPLSMSERTEADVEIRRHGHGFSFAGSAPWAVEADHGTRTARTIDGMIGMRRSAFPAPAGAGGGQGGTLADLKTMDGGAFEARAVYAGGGNIVDFLALAGVDT